MGRRCWYRWLGPLVLLAALADTEGCWFRRHRTFTPPPAPAATEPQSPPAIPPPPEVTPEPGKPPAVPAEQLPQVEAPKPKTRPPQSQPSRPAAQAETSPSTPPAPAPAAPPPRLGQIFTPEQVRDYNRQLDDSLARVRSVLGVAEKRRLTGEQADMVNRIRTFQRQAEQVREQDLVTAVNLASRADLLARDLLAQLQ